MVSNHHFTRIDTMEIKNQIFQKIGQQRGEKYFDQLKKWFSSKICKVEFDEVCVQTIGKENVALHNRLIRSIIKNACMATTSPKIRKVDSCLAVKVPNGNQRTCLQSPPYGDALLLPQSPRRNRTPVLRHRKCTNRPSPLGPLGKSPTTVTGKSPSIITEEVAMRVQEQQSAGELLSVGSGPPPVVSVESGEEVEQLADRDSPSVQSQVPVTAPFGVSINVGGTRRSLWNRHMGKTCQSSDYLPDTLTLRKHLEKRLEGEGVGVSLDTANLINHGLDVYMRRLIGSSIGIARSYDGGENVALSNSQYISRLNGQTPSFYPQSPTNVGIYDFRVAMETNPCILGEDWPILLEKLCFRTSEQ